MHGANTFSAYSRLGAIQVSCAAALALACPVGSSCILFDRGSQYRSDAPPALLLKHALLRSMRAMGSCYERARTEGFFTTQHVA